MPKEKFQKVEENPIEKRTIELVRGGYGRKIAEKISLLEIATEELKEQEKELEGKKSANRAKKLSSLKEVIQKNETELAQLRRKKTTLGTGTETTDSTKDLRSNKSDYEVLPSEDSSFIEKHGGAEKIKILSKEEEKTESEDTREMFGKMEFYSSLTKEELEDYYGVYKDLENSAKNDEGKEKAKQQVILIDREIKNREKANKIGSFADKIIEAKKGMEEISEKQKPMAKFYAHESMSDKILDDLENFYKGKINQDLGEEEKKKAEENMLAVKTEKVRRENLKTDKKAGISGVMESLDMNTKLGNLVEGLRQNIEKGGQEKRKIYSSENMSDDMLKYFENYYTKKKDGALNEEERKDAEENLSSIENEKNNRTRKTREQGGAVYKKQLDEIVNGTIAQGKSREEKMKFYAGVSSEMLDSFYAYYENKKNDPTINRNEIKDAEENLFAIGEARKTLEAKQKELSAIDGKYNPKIETAQGELEALLKEQRDNEELIKQLGGEGTPGKGKEAREQKEQMLLNKMEDLNRQLEAAILAGNQVEIERLKAELLKAEREYGDFAKEGDKGGKDDGEEPEPKSKERNIEKEIEDFINSLGLENMVSPEFRNMTQAQQLLVLQELKQRIIDLVKEDAKTQYSKELRDKMVINSPSKGILSKAGNWTKNVWTGMKEGVKKEVVLKNIESDAFKKMLENEEGKERILRNLDQLVKINKDKNVILNTEKEPVIDYSRSLNLENPSTEEKIAIARYNQAANEFRQIPDEWGQESKKVLSGKKKIFEGKHRKEYERVKALYEESKKEITNLRKARGETESNIVMGMAQLDIAMRQDQLINTHPEVEEVYMHLADKAGTAEYRKKRLAFLNNMTGGPNNANKVAFGVGYALRMGSKAFTGLAVKTGLMSATAAGWTTLVAAPVLGGAIGSWRGILRGRSAIREKEMAARHGGKDMEKSRVATVDATHLDRQLEELLKKIKEETYYSDVNEKDKDKARKKYIALLNTRIEHTQGKMAKGEVNYGNAENSLNNTSNLINTLNEALATREMLNKETENEVSERINSLLQFSAEGVRERTTEAKRKFLTKQIGKGALWGATMGLAGYGARTVMEHTGASEWMGEKFHQTGELIHDAGEKVGVFKAIEALGLDHSETVIDSTGAVRSMTPDGNTVVFPKDIHDSIKIIDHDGKITTVAPEIKTLPNGAVEIKAPDGTIQTISPGKDTIVIKTPTGGETTIIHSTNDLGESITDIKEPNGEEISTMTNSEGETTTFIRSADKTETVKINPDGTKETTHYEEDGDKIISTTTDEKGNVIRQDSIVKQQPEGEKPDAETEDQTATEDKTETQSKSDTSTTKTEEESQSDTTSSTKTQTETGEESQQADGTEEKDQSGGTKTEETKVPVGDRAITAEFKVTLGQNGVPQNLETVFNQISANQLDLATDGVIDEEFATKSLNMAANLVQLSEGHSVIGIDPSEFKDAVSVENGVLEIKDHDAFNQILAKLQTHAGEAWDNGTLQSKGGAVTYIGRISHDNWLKIAHADGMHEDVDGTDTGIAGHPDATDVKDFSNSEIIEKAGGTTPMEEASSSRELSPEEIAEQQTIAGLAPTTPPEATFENATMGDLTSSEKLATLAPRGINEIPVPKDNTLHGIYDDVEVTGKDLAKVMKVEEHNIHKIFKGSEGKKIWEEIKVKKTPAKEILEMKGNNEKLLAYNSKEFLGKRTYGMMGPENGGEETDFDSKPTNPKYEPLAEHLNDLQRLSGLRPIEKNLLQSDESVEKFMTRALKKILKMGKIDEVKL